MGTVTHWQPQAIEGGTVVKRQKDNKVFINDKLEPALKNHTFARYTDQYGNESKGYVEVQYNHQEYPKLMYHPQWGQRPEPKMSDFTRSANTVEQQEQAFERYQRALNEWRRSNREKFATNPKREKELLAKGWLPRPPAKPESPETDPNSDEL